MRLWHKDLIAVLPDNQLRGQWRECCLIAKGLHDGTLNHLLVNKVKKYSSAHMFKYGQKVAAELMERGFKINFDAFAKYFCLLVVYEDDFPVHNNMLFAGWHNDRYLRQCYYNLQEKYDCGGIAENEWRRIEAVIDERL